jgi:drug/metabolite transporter (DMT)-like permease
LGAYFVITINPLKPDLIIRYVDLTGLALALVSSILMAILVVITSFSTQVQSNPVNVYLQQTTALTVTYLSLSIFTKESWAPFLHLNFSYLGYLLVFFVIVFIAGGLTVSAISKVNTTIFSSLLSLRLVVVLVAGWFILGEQLTSVYQYSGAALIIVAITWYLWRQNISNENQSERKMQDFTIDGSRR